MAILFVRKAKILLEALRFSLNRAITGRLKTTSNVSDLFFWRVDCDFNTAFFLINPKWLLSPHGNIECPVDIHFYDSSGCLIYQISKNILSPSLIVDLGSFSRLRDFGCGTFALNYSNAGLTADIWSDDSVGVFAERGMLQLSYVGHASSPSHSWVHGNFDAVQFEEGVASSIVPSKLLRRVFNIQYAFRVEPCISYQLIFTNPSNFRQTFQIEIVESSGNKRVGIYRFLINSFGCRILPLEDFLGMKSKQGMSYRLRVKSRMPMARPLIVKFENNVLDVFHA